MAHVHYLSEFINKDTIERLKEKYITEKNDLYQYGVAYRQLWTHLIKCLDLDDVKAGDILELDPSSTTRPRIMSQGLLKSTTKVFWNGKETKPLSFLLDDSGHLPASIDLTVPDKFPINHWHTAITTSHVVPFNHQLYAKELLATYTALSNYKDIKVQTQQLSRATFTDEKKQEWILYIQWEASTPLNVDQQKAVWTAYLKEAAVSVCSTMEPLKNWQDDKGEMPSYNKDTTLLLRIRARLENKEVSCSGYVVFWK